MERSHPAAYGGRRPRVRRRAPERGKPPPADTLQQMPRHGARPASIWPPRVAVLQRAPERRHGGGPPPVDALQLILRYGAGPASRWSPRFAVLQRASERRHGLLQTSSKSKYGYLPWLILFLGIFAIMGTTCDRNLYFSKNLFVN